MLDRRMNDRGKMWRHVYKVRIMKYHAEYRHCKSSIIVFTAVRKMWFDGVKITYMSLNLFGSFSISTMTESIRVQIVLSLVVLC
jgi:hypothetical protein